MARLKRMDKTAMPTSLIFDFAHSDLLLALLYRAKPVIEVAPERPVYCWCRFDRTDRMPARMLRRLEMVQLLADDANIADFFVFFTACAGRHRFTARLCCAPQEEGRVRIEITPIDSYVDEPAFHAFMRRLASVGQTLSKAMRAGAYVRLGLECSQLASIETQVAMRLCHQWSDVLAMYQSWLKPIVREAAPGRTRQGRMSLARKAQQGRKPRGSVLKRGRYRTSTGSFAEHP